jgi:hypothetical protein
MQKQFNITSVSREDCESIGFDVSKLTDEDMQKVADAMGESYCNGNACFWSDLESILIDVYKLKQSNV